MFSFFTCVSASADRTCHLCDGCQGRSDGGISVYIYPQNQSTLHFYVVTGCFFSLTQDKLLLILKLE